MLGFFNKKRRVKRKEASESFLRTRGIKINYHLPVIESENEVKLRTAKEIAERVSLLSIVSFVAFENCTGQ